jgi:hypothetical protein
MSLKIYELFTFFNFHDQVYLLPACYGHLHKISDGLIYDRSKAWQFV